MAGIEVNDADDFRDNNLMTEEEEHQTTKTPCYMIDPKSPITVFWDIIVNVLRLASMLTTPFFFVFVQF